MISVDKLKFLKIFGTKGKEGHADDAGHHGDKNVQNWRGSTRCLALRSLVMARPIAELSGESWRRTDKNGA